MSTRGTAIAVGRARRVLSVPLREINLPSIRPFNELSNGHMQIHLAISEMQRLEYCAVARGALKSLQNR